MHGISHLYCFDLKASVDLVEICILKLIILTT